MLMNNLGIKPYFLILFLVVVIFTSCKNDNSLIENVEETEQSNAARIAITKLKTLFNPNGTLNVEGNRIGNIIFDFGFKFKFPETLSYNNGTSIVVENFEDLVNTAVNMTDSLYINGIAFPFQVETFSNRTIKLETINNEVEFISLLENRNIIDVLNCNCMESNYNPVCVEILNTDNEIFTFQFPNFCYAECEGFTESDIISCYSGNPPLGDGNFGDCFELRYPLAIINNDSNETLLINNENEFYNSLLLNYNLSFVFPFNIIINGQSSTINKEDNLNNILINCSFLNCWNDCPTDYNPVCVQFEQDGQTIVIDYYNACYAFCDGFTEEDFVDCYTLFNCYNDCSSVNQNACVNVNLTGLNSNYFVTFKYRNACLATCAGFLPENIFECN